MTPKKLSELLFSLSEGKIQIAETDYDTELNRLGVDSVLLLTLIVAIEDTLNYEWSEDVDDGVFKSLGSISEFLSSECVDS